MANTNTMVELVRGWGGFPANGCQTLTNPLVDTLFLASTGPTPGAVLQATLKSAKVPTVGQPNPIEIYDGVPFYVTVAGKVTANGASNAVTIKLWQNFLLTTELSSVSLFSTGSTGSWVASDVNYTGATTYAGTFRLEFEVAWDGASNSIQGIGYGHVGKSSIAQAALSAFPAVDQDIPNNPLYSSVNLAASIAFSSSSTTNTAVLTEFSVSR